MEWTAEKVERLTIDQVRALRGNAAKRKAQNIVDLCDAELNRRRAPSTRGRTSFKKDHTGEAVKGFHFVCPSEKGITRNPDGTIWTGTWVVDKNRAERAVKIEAYVALHVTKSEPSYLQGVIRDWRVEKREARYAEGQTVKTKFGIDFLIELTGESLKWNGDGAGEKGYFYDECDGSNSSRLDRKTVDQQ